MGIKFHCPNGHKIHVKSFLAGKKGKCPACGVSVDIPAEEQSTVGDAPPMPAPVNAPTATNPPVRLAPPVAASAAPPAPAAAPYPHHPGGPPVPPGYGVPAVGLPPASMPGGAYPTQYPPVMGVPLPPGSKGPRTMGGPAVPSWSEPDPFAAISVPAVQNAPLHRHAHARKKGDKYSIWFTIGMFALAIVMFGLLILVISNQSAPKTPSTPTPSSLPPEQSVPESPVPGDSQPVPSAVQ